MDKIRSAMRRDTALAQVQGHVDGGLAVLETLTAPAPETLVLLPDEARRRLLQAQSDLRRTQRTLASAARYIRLVEQGATDSNGERLYIGDKVLYEEDYGPNDTRLEWARIVNLELAEDEARWVAKLHPELAENADLVTWRDTRYVFVVPSMRKVEGE